MPPSHSSSGKLAIVECLGSETGYVGLFCEESPEVWFVDTVKVPVTGHCTVYDLDIRFVTVCEPDSIVVSGLVPDLPVACGGSVERGRLSVLVNDGPLGLPSQVVATVRGIRRGYAGVRFPAKLREEMENNNAFWSRAQTGRR